MSGLSRALMLFGAVVVVGAIVVAVRGRGGPANVGEVPATLPANGVDIGGQVILKRLVTPPAHAISQAAAIAKARRVATKRKLPAMALEAAVTVNGNEHVQSRPGWVVTFTSPKPVDVGQGGKTILVRHYSVAVDAETGKFLVGFFTK